MKLKIIEVEGSQEEVKSILDSLPQPVGASLSLESRAAEPPSRSYLTREFAEALWLHCPAGSYQRLVIETLVRKGGKATQSDLFQAGGWDKNEESKAGRVLAGVLASITNNAKRIARRLDARLIEGGWGLPYRLPAEALPLFRALIDDGENSQQAG